MNHTKAILFTIGLIIGDFALGHYSHLIALCFTLCEILFGGFLLLSNVKIYLKVIIIILLLISSNLSFRIININEMDSEGAGVANLFFMVTTALITIITFSLLLYKNKGKILYISILCLLILLTTTMYLSWFGSLGLIDSSNASKTKEISQKKNLFIGVLNFSYNQMHYKNDSLKIINGWCEKQTIIDHSHLIKRYDDTSSINYVIQLKGNKSFDKLNIYYNINDTSMNGSSSVDSTLTFSCLKSITPVVLTFFKMGETWTKSSTIKQIRIYRK